MPGPRPLGHRPVGGPPAPAAAGNDARTRGPRCPLRSARQLPRRGPASARSTAAWSPRPGPRAGRPADRAPARPSMAAANSVPDPAAPGSQRAGIAQQDTDWAVIDLARRSAVLADHVRRVRAFFQKPGFVEDQPAAGIPPMWHALRAPLVTDRVGAPHTAATCQLCLRSAALSQPRRYAKTRSRDCARAN
jgi:hypothetical protein